MRPFWVTAAERARYYPTQITECSNDTTCTTYIEIIENSRATAQPAHHYSKGSFPPVPTLFLCSSRTAVSSSFWPMYASKMCLPFIITFLSTCSKLWTIRFFPRNGSAGGSRSVLRQSLLLSPTPFLITEFRRESDFLSAPDCQEDSAGTDSQMKFCKRNRVYIPQNFEPPRLTSGPRLYGFKRHMHRWWGSPLFYRSHFYILTAIFSKCLLQATPLRSPTPATFQMNREYSLAVCCKITCQYGLHTL